MITIIAGSRDITWMPLLEEAIHNCPFMISKVYCGMAPGADTLGWSWANKNGVPVQNFPAEWEKDGKKAGPLRNQRMIDAGAEALLALWDGHSPGTKDMIKRAKDSGLYVYVMQAIQIWTPIKEEVWPPKIITTSTTTTTKVTGIEMRKIGPAEKSQC